MQALEGIKILDLSRLAPGPFASMMLGDLGADVLLVEAPPRADGRHRTSQAPMPNECRRSTRCAATSAAWCSACAAGRGRSSYKLVDAADVVLEAFGRGGQAPEMDAGR
jgi:crotonobetainyl-CoA:carnitine CoA-transferase CaiB-like acyl-CoA transferase